MTTVTRAVPTLGDVGLGWRREIAESMPMRRRRVRPDPALAAFVRAGAIEGGHQLPVPRTPEACRHKRDAHSQTAARRPRWWSRLRRRR